MATTNTVRLHRVLTAKLEKVYRAAPHHNRRCTRCKSLERLHDAERASARPNALGGCAAEPERWL
jgi:hypothetical protein